MAEILRLGINGYGRIGRLCLRATHENLAEFGRVKVHVINDAFGSGKIERSKVVQQMALLTARDTVHGRFPTLISVEAERALLRVGGIPIEVFNQKEVPPWAISGLI